MKKLIIAVILFAFIAGQVHAETIGKASWYGNESGRYTANGERFRPNGLTAASWYFPFNTWLKVTCLKSGKCVLVRVNDRGPSKRLHRLIDLSEGAAAKIGLLHAGVGKVRVEVVR
jgi:rare lipoprotein A